MSNVTLTIGGRPFTVSASDGDESHVEMLGRMIDERVRRIGSQNQPEARMLLFTALMMADELHDAHKQAPAPDPVAEAPVAPAEPAGPSPEVIARVEALAARVEKLAAHLEQAGLTS